MKIAVLGAGNVGSTLGQSWSRRGHEVIYGVRQPESGNASQATVADAAARAEVVAITLPWPAVKGVLEGLNLTGKVVLDCTNPLKPDLSLDTSAGASGGESVAKWAKGARVVKIFNTTGFNNMANPAYGGKPIMMCYCGDDAEAKRIAAGLAADTGFDPVDAGPLSNAGLLEHYAVLWIWLAVKGGLGRDFAFTIAKR
jgi:8-hydroxy-5-deazaflavin:NADPH oxidoreductase